MSNPKGRFGAHGGQYIPETLMNAVIELEEAYERCKNDPAFNRELTALLAQRQSLFPGLTLENLLTGILHNRLGRTVLRYGGRKLSASAADLTRRDLDAIAGDCKGFLLPSPGTWGWSTPR